MLRFDDQVVLITGAGRGIGRQHALFLADRGAKIVVNDYGGGLRGENGNDPAPADAVVAQIHAAGGNAMAACCDVGDAAQVRAMVDAVGERFGRLDAIIHNASTFAELGSFIDARAEDLERIMRVNALGGWNVAHAAWRLMVAQGYGRVVITGSGAGFFGRRKDQAYSVAKSALMGLTKVLATEGEALGIKVNLVGPVAWTGTSQAMGMPSVMADFAPPIFVSNLVAVLAHADCPVNGEMFHCGGGLVTRVFVGETPGTVFRAETMTPEAVLAEMNHILDETGYAIPASSDRSGARLSAAIASVNPAFAEVLAEAKRNR
ncbi:SDR family NAD(P)-dependent oxidoreductase [Aromatoleum petrolei]|uniref:SDR family NAD(P)-dependent oxidoreductase n=1 Tax=Aromatoleum petrolei TaxID=76116 RepID=A0ABX1MPI0_9RHOO|nr:SDR family NAD(P)-dependent oxidoreductase [Aromatoleum petrolei]NMF88606.1 SDR family NAD(P)-dependent oxidoreductase [Aromatoleum petrolei]QTQ34686.1 Short-chain dehydrogenase/reductase [Aromatoleum petrolei]